MIAAVFMAAPALAGNNPDFDAVAEDACNFFASQNIITQVLIDGNLVLAGLKLNYMSNWCDGYWTRAEVFQDIERLFLAAGCPANALPFVGTDSAKNSDMNPHEFFYTSVSDVASPSTCFPGYFSMRALWFNTYFYAWKIVLQKKPETDLQIKIVDCVLKHQGDDLFFDAEETGWYNDPQFGRLDTGVRPTVTAIAYPGPNRSLGFNAPFILTGIAQPGGGPVRLCKIPYTSKGPFEEAILVAMPVAGGAGGQFPLHAGDEILVIVFVQNLPNDLEYGQDNVRIEYVGYVGSEFWNGAQVAAYNEVCGDADSTCP
jgi:hypothetical protein